MHYHAEFARGQWNPDDFFHTAIFDHTYRKPFEQEDDCIVNGSAPESGQNPDQEHLAGGLAPEAVPGLDRYEYAYISYTYKNPVTAPCSLQSTFQFDAFGAPTWYYAEEILQEDGKWILGTHIEATIWEEGINFWHLELRDHQHKVTLLHHEKFAPEAGVPHQIEMMIEPDRVGARLDGHEAWIPFDAYSKGYAGFLACEGINRFYDFTVQNKEKAE